MDTYEAKNLLAESLMCLARSMEQIRLRETEKCVGFDEPMQDHLAQCTHNRHPHEYSTVKECLEYLELLYKGFKTASDHEILLEKRFKLAELETGQICDMIMGFIGHGFPDDLVACAKEVKELSEKFLSHKDYRMKSDESCRIVVGGFLKAASEVIEKHGYKTWEYGTYSLPLAYLGSWMVRKYWE